MPELPEVETVARQLDKKIAGKEIAGVEVLREKAFIGNPKQLVGKKIKEVDRYAKVIVFDLGKVNVMVHLKMTGQLVWRPGSRSQRKDQRSEAADMKKPYEGVQVVGGHPSEDWLKQLPSSHTRVVITFKDKSRLFFNDMRVFGWMKVVSEEEIKKYREGLPPDVVDKEFTQKYFAEALSRTGRMIKVVLMDQQKMGGVGNIYANDALNMAKVNPEKAANKLNGDEVAKLYKAVKKVINLGIKYKGATYSNFRDSEGLGGNYQDHFVVYKRDGEKCRNCGGKIVKAMVGGRGTYWCEKCQR